jgi:RNA polymerase sigma factor (sigma-70 family)
MDSTVFVLDDDDSFVRAISRLLRADGFGVQCWTSASDFLAAHDPQVPGCLLTDLLMPEMSGLELQRRLLARGSKLPVVFITGRGDMSMAVEGMRAGAVSFLPKPVNRAKLIAVVNEALARDEDTRRALGEQQRIRELVASLTPRERQVLDLVAQGYRNKQIAAELGTAEKTIKVHRGRLMHKLHVRSVAGLVQLLGLCEEVRVMHLDPVRAAAWPASGTASL